MRRRPTPDGHVSGNRRRRIVVSIYDDARNPHYAGGGPAVVQRIVESLMDGYDVTLVTGGHPGARRTIRDSVTYVPLPLAWAGPRTGQVLYTLLLMVLARFARYDLWLESFTPPFSSSFLPMVTRRPVVGVAQALSGREMSRRYKLPIFRHGERWALRGYTDVVVLNEHDGAQVSASSPRSRVHHIPNVTAVRPVQAGDAGQGHYALFMGRIDFTQKGLDLLFRAYDRLDASALPLVIAGNGRNPEVRALRSALAAAGPKASWIGYVSGAEKDVTLADCAFVVIPSVEESFCLVALEAMALGRPVIHFDLPQLSWIPVDCGITVPRFDVAALAEAVRALSIDVERRTAAGLRARKFAEQFLREHAGDAYRRLADDLLGAPQEPAAAGSRPGVSRPGPR